MSDVARFNPTSRFSGLAEVYAKHRPDYPPAAIEHILKQSGLEGGGLLVDVGCGTGISSRLFANRGVHVVGVEPNDDMRRRAEMESNGLPVRYLKGTAEGTGLEVQSATAVLAAQAFHWFNAPAALTEFHRILRPEAWVALMWNERDESHPATAAFGDVIRSGPDTAAIETPRLQSGAALQQCPLFAKQHFVPFSHQQEMDEPGLLGRAFSISYAPREEQAAEVFATRLRDVFRRFQQDGRIVLKYETRVYYGQRVA